MLLDTIPLRTDMRMLINNAYDSLSAKPLGLRLSDTIPLRTDRSMLIGPCLEK